MLAGVAYWLLAHAIICHEGSDSLIAKAIGKDGKGKLSVALYGLAIPLAFVHVALSQIIYVGVALMWLIPDRRIEKVMAADVK